MTEDTVHHCREAHRLSGASQARNAGRTRLVLVLTLVMMIAEVAAGIVFGSMALLADGWHMASHAAVLGIAVFAYAYAQRHAANTTYTFGTGKVGDLAAFTSALLLGVIAVLMAVESAQRLAAPVAIAFDEAMGVAVLGLIVNLVSAWLLRGEDHHGHSHGPENHERDHEHTHDDTEHHDHSRDNNLQAAYMHVLADALTSVLAIAALAAGMFFGLNWMDPAMGLLGAIVIARWSWTLMQSSGRVLLDATPTEATEKAVRRAIETEHTTRIADLHIWRIAPGQLAAVLTVTTPSPQPPAHYKALLQGISGLCHTTVEVERI